MSHSVIIRRRRSTNYVVRHMSRVTCHASPVAHIGSVEHTIGAQNDTGCGTIQLRIRHVFQHTLFETNVTRHKSHATRRTISTCIASTLLCSALEMKSSQFSPRPALANSSSNSQPSITRWHNCHAAVPIIKTTTLYLTKSANDFTVAAVTVEHSDEERRCVACGGWHPHQHSILDELV